MPHSAARTEPDEAEAAEPGAAEAEAGAEAAREAAYESAETPALRLPRGFHGCSSLISFTIVRMTSTLPSRCGLSPMPSSSGLQSPNSLLSAPLPLLLVDARIVSSTRRAQSVRSSSSRLPSSVRVWYCVTPSGPVSADAAICRDGEGSVRGAR